MITRLVALSLLLARLAATAGEPAPENASQSGFASALRPSEGLLELRYNGRRLLLYAFATNQFKPYVRELHTLQGDNILLDAPPDHLHHHGLMYAIRVNGVNFWEERDQPGWQRSVDVTPPRTGASPAGLPQVSFTHLIHWVAHENRAVQDTAPVALLIERRTLTLTVDDALQEVTLAWHGDFRVGRGAPKVTLTGANYHGLGLRLPEPFNRVARHQNSENAAYPTNGTGDVTAARWSSVSHRIGGREITVALFGRPSPAGGLPRFFTMVQPFTYLSVTQGLDKTPIDYAAGEKFTLDYLLAVYSKPCQPEFLQQRYERWKP